MPPLPRPCPGDHLPLSGYKVIISMTPGTGDGGDTECCNNHSNVAKIASTLRTMYSCRILRNNGGLVPSETHLYCTV